MSTNLDPTMQPTTPNPAAPSTPPIPSRATSAAPTTRLTDEEQAFRSLDDTAMQPVPSPTALWEAVENASQPAPTSERRPFRVRTAVLVCAVAVVSFVAGGVTARLSSQMPLLFSEKPASTENTASYVERPQQVAPVEEQAEPETTPEELLPEEDYTTTDDTQLTDEGSGDYTWQWDLDPEGNNQFTYDYDNQNMTFEYNGYSLTVPIGELIGYDQSYPTTDNSWQDSSPRERDYGWGGQSNGNGWYGEYSA